MKQYEYKIYYQEEDSEYSNTDILNKYGIEGWELKTTFDYEYYVGDTQCKGTRFIFMREKE